MNPGYMAEQSGCIHSVGTHHRPQGTEVFSICIRCVYLFTFVIVGERRIRKLYLFLCYGLERYHVTCLASSLCPSKNEPEKALFSPDCSCLGLINDPTLLRGPFPQQHLNPVPSLAILLCMTAIDGFNLVCAEQCV